VLALAVSSVAVAALAVTTGAWLAGPAGWPERVLCGLGALVLLYLEPAAVGVGLVVVTAAVVVHLLARPRRAAAAAESAPGGEQDDTLEARRNP
jgi:hypothetical protein